MQDVIGSAVNAFGWWRKTRISERCERLAALAGVLIQRHASVEHLITAEVAQTVSLARDEVRKCAAYARWLAANGAHILAPRHAAGAEIHYRPLGVIAGIMPWNFPFWQVFRFATAALLAGNVVLVKHSPLAPRCAAAVSDLFRACGFEHVFFCESGSAKIAQDLIADARVQAVAFTGCVETGRCVAGLAGRHLKKCVLELGGSDAFIVMPSADIRGAASRAIASRIRAGGQACTAAKRFIVHAAVADDFEAQFVAGMRALKTGDPFDLTTDVGPLIHEAAADRLERQVDDSVRAGAVLLCGGRRIASRVYEPTVLRIRSVDVPVMQEETFGPVAPILRVNSLEEAIETANASIFGLNASVWTAEESELAAFRSELEIGQLFVNTAASSRIDLPFGGTKASGFGRILADAGVYEFVNVTTEVRPCEPSPTAQMRAR